MAAALRAGGLPGTPGPPAPDFELESHTGERVRLSGYHGTNSVVLFFMRAYT
jgi:peroxiredoxin